MTAILEIRGLIKNHQGLRPLRIRELTVMPNDILSIAGLDATAAETFVLLVTGADAPRRGRHRHVRAEYSRHHRR